ncbi:MAG: multicopper oxidase domain-containing protein [Candidatus Dadabacteria bacterium]|nr:multicopper oxidase domain-containing protein [Candidatus Dadabacteria bacterium]
MERKLSRRNLLKNVTAAVVSGATVATAGEKSTHEHMKMGAMDQMDITKDSFPRIDPNRKYSPPPPLMGKQMGRVHTLSHPPLGYEMEGNVKVFHLIAQPVKVTITKGTKDHHPSTRKFQPMPTWPKEMIAWGYNGVCPGPTLEATEGDRVRIVFKNELPEPSSIHWHGMELPFSQDGAAGYNPYDPQLPVPPGKTHVYEFRLYQSGTLIYHTGFNMMKQDGLGLGGLFVIHPKNPQYTIDKDFAILLQTWNFSPGNKNPNITAMEASFATFNGKTAPDIEMMKVKQGDLVRIRIGNLSLMAHPIHLHGYTFKIVGTTGGPIPESAQWPEVTVNVPPGSSRDIEFVAWNPGTWRFHCHILHHIMNAMTDMPMGIASAEGMFTHLQVTPTDSNYNPKDPTAPWKPPTREVTE